MAHIHVIIPVYNAKKYLREAVDSVLNQPCKDIDIVLVNDGSTDGSAELCDQIAVQEERVSVIHQENGGVSAARNAGIEYVAMGSMNDNYVAFLDADDKWANDFFDEDTNSLLGKGYSLIGFQSCMCNADCTKRADAIPLNEGEFAGGVSSVWLHAVQHFGAMIYSMELIVRYNLRFPLVKYCEDRSFIMQCIYLADRICLKNRLMYYYRQHQTSAVHTRPLGIKHFVPIIDTWIQTDDMMASYENKSRGKLREGYNLARIYIMDLLDEHYRIGGKEKEIKQLIESNSKYVELWKSEIGTASLKRRYQLAEKHPRMHRIKNRFYGIVWFCTLRIKRVKLVRRIAEQRKYTISI